MTTDITELAQRVERIISDMRLKHGDKDTYAPVMKWDEFLALVEALEARDKQIANDVQIKARLCRESNSLHDRLREAEKRIAELESRTVKLPEPEQWDISQILLCKKKVVAAIRDAGIKMEAE